MMLRVCSLVGEPGSLVGRQVSAVCGCLLLCWLCDLAGLCNRLDCCAPVSPCLFCVCCALSPHWCPRLCLASGKRCAFCSGVASWGGWGVGWPGCCVGGGGCYSGSGWGRHSFSLSLSLPPPPPPPGLSLVASVSPTLVSRAGERVSFSFVVVNSGEVALSDVRVSFSFAAPAGPALTNIVCSGGGQLLEPGGRVTCTADEYVVTQSDIGNRGIFGTARASGVSGGSAVRVQSNETEVAVAVQGWLPGLSVTMSASPSRMLVRVGDSVVFSFVLTNSGNLPMSGIRIDSNRAGLLADSLGDAAVVCPADAQPLAPGNSLTCTGSYIIKEADVQGAGDGYNQLKEKSATASGRAVAPSGELVGPLVWSNPAYAEVTSLYPRLVISAHTKSATSYSSYGRHGGRVSGLGETIELVIDVSNYGTVAGSDIQGGDVFVPRNSGFTFTCPVGHTLPPGGVRRCTVSPYTVTEVDVRDALLRGDPDENPMGYFIIGKLTAAGQWRDSGFSGGARSAESEISLKVEKAETEPRLKIHPSIYRSMIFGRGEAVVNFQITNKGDLPMENIQVRTIPGARSGRPGQIPVGVEVRDITCPADEQPLEPLTNMRCWGFYTVTAEDEAAGSFFVRAEVVGQTISLPWREVQSASDSSELHSPIFPLTAELSLVQRVSPERVYRAGQELQYEFGVQSVGSWDLDWLSLPDSEQQLRFSDTLRLPFHLRSEIHDSNNDDPTQIGLEQKFRGNYRVTQDDMDRGVIRNTVTARADATYRNLSAVPPYVSPVSNETETVVEVIQLPSLSVETYTAEESAMAVGDLVRYYFKVKNTGNVTMSDVRIENTFV